MNIKDYVALKGASKVSLSKKKVTVREKEVDGDGNTIREKEERDGVFLTEKCYNGATGEALSDCKREVELRNYEHEKERAESVKVEAQAQIDANGAIITDIKAL